MLDLVPLDGPCVAAADPYRIFTWVGVMILTITLAIVMMCIIAKHLAVSYVLRAAPQVELGTSDLRIIFPHRAINNVTVMVNEIYSISLPLLKAGTNVIDLADLKSPDGRALRTTTEVRKVGICGQVGGRRIDSTIQFGEGKGYSFSCGEITLGNREKIE